MIDHPKVLPPLAFGVLPPEIQPPPGITVHSYQLATALPQAPSEVNVFLAGSYPPTYTTMLRTMRNVQGWQFIPEYSLIQHFTNTPVGDKRPVANEREAAQRAAQLLQEYGLLMSDSVTPTIQVMTDGTWRIFFFRRIAGMIVYTNKALAVQLNKDGQATEIIGRRRPLLAQSRYPIRSAEEAWHALTQSRWLMMNVDDGSSARGEGYHETIDQYVVQRVELVYVEGEVTDAEQFIQPYYVFRDDIGHALYVPAVVDSQMTWPASRS